MTALPRGAVSGNKWGIGHALVGFAAGLLIGGLASAIAASAVHYKLGSGGDVPVAVTVASVVGLWAGLLGAVFAGSRTRGQGRLGADYGWGWRRWTDVPLGVVVGLGSQFVLIPLIYLPFEHVDKHLRHDLSQPAQHMAGAAHTALPAVVLVAVLAAGAPFVEELFFRGLVLRSLLGRVPVPVAIIVSALLFALAHGEALQFAGLALFGVVLGVLAWRTGRLAASIAAHASFNLVAVLSVVHLH